MLYYPLLLSSEGPHPYYHRIHSCRSTVEVAVRKDVVMVVVVVLGEVRKSRPH